MSLTGYCETSSVTGFVRDYGLLIVFLAVGLETSGLPLPGETALVAAAVLASQGHFSVVSVIVVGAVAAILGDNLGYWLGRWLGRGFLARWFSGFRIAGAWVAGFAHMSWWRFFFWNAAGGIAWATTVVLVAYYAGAAAADAFAHYGLLGGAVIVGLALIAVFGLHFWRRRVVEES